MSISDSKNYDVKFSINCSQNYIPDWPITLISCDVLNRGDENSTEKLCATIKVYNAQEKPIESFKLMLTVLDLEGVILEKTDPLIITYHQTFESKQLVRIETSQIIPRETCELVFNLSYVLYELGEIEYFDDTNERIILEGLEPVMFNGGDDSLFLDTYILNQHLNSRPKFYHSKTRDSHWGCAICGCYNLNELNHCLACGTMLEVQKHFTKGTLETARQKWIANNQEQQAEQEQKLRLEQEQKLQIEQEQKLQVEQEQKLQLEQEQKLQDEQEQKLQLEQKLQAEQEYEIRMVAKAKDKALKEYKKVKGVTWRVTL